MAGALDFAGVERFDAAGALGKGNDRNRHPFGGGAGEVGGLGPAACGNYSTRRMRRMGTGSFRIWPRTTSTSVGASVGNC